MEKANLQPVSNASPDQIAVDETVIRINGQWYWLYAAVNPISNKFLHVRLFPTTTTALTEQFLQELREKHDIEDAVFLVDPAQHLKNSITARWASIPNRSAWNRNVVGRIFQEIKRRTTPFNNSFSHVDPTTAESWLQAFAVWWSSLN